MTSKNRLRYVDDIFVITNRGLSISPALLDKLDSYDQNIQFTVRRIREK